MSPNLPLHSLPPKKPPSTSLLRPQLQAASVSAFVFLHLPPLPAHIQASFRAASAGKPRTLPHAKVSMVFHTPTRLSSLFSSHDLCHPGSLALGGFPVYLPGCPSPSHGWTFLQGLQTSRVSPGGSQTLPLNGNPAHPLLPSLLATGSRQREYHPPVAKPQAWESAFTPPSMSIQVQSISKASVARLTLEISSASSGPPCRPDPIISHCLLVCRAPSPISWRLSYPPTPHHMRFFVNQVCPCPPVWFHLFPMASFSPCHPPCLRAGISNTLKRVWP